MASEHLLNQLIMHEGMESQAYQCSEGYWTIGVGRNIQTLGITKDEAMYLLANDLKRVENERSTTICHGGAIYLRRVKIAALCVLTLGSVVFCSLKISGRHCGRSLGR